MYYSGVVALNKEPFDFGRLSSGSTQKLKKGSYANLANKVERLLKGNPAPKSVGFLISLRGVPVFTPCQAVITNIDDIGLVVAGVSSEGNPTGFVFTVSKNDTVVLTAVN